jgi:CPA1 family monovalent cation:H+ antiporter
VALLFGSIVSATDPVAVVSVFRHLRAPRRLSVIVEGESLINDGVAITLYTALLALALTGETDTLGAVVLFVREALGGVLVGAGLGLLFVALTSVIDDHLLEMTLSTALAYGSYLAAQRLGCSGALACVTAGLLHGSLGRRAGMSEANRRLLDDLWEYLGFVANAIVFLLLGLTVDFSSLVQSAPAVVVAILAVFAARVAVIEALQLVPGVWRTTSIGERVILVWGGLRGALTAALALALPPGTPARDAIIAMAFGVVLFSLIVQGSTLTFVLRRCAPGEPQKIDSS